jgi:TonB family protein
MLEMLRDRDYLRHRGVGLLFWNGFSLRGQSQLAPSCFLHNQRYVTQNPAVLTLQSRGERLRSLAAKLVLFVRSPAKVHPVLQPQNHSTLVMSNYSTIDRESLQKVLASAFAVQHSQMDRRSLSAIVEAGRLVMNGELDVDGAMHRIVDRTRQVAITAGVAIDPLCSVQPSLPGIEEDDRSSGVFPPYLASTRSAHDAGAVADIALDLVLTDIAEQARLATKAGAAAVVLMRGEEMVCRVTTGESSSELDVLLNARAGLCGDCMQTRKAQCCADTDTDSRVDAVACRRLGIRSFVVFPVLKQEELVGLFAIFSPRLKAFGDEDIQTLQALSQQILISLNCAVELSTPLPGDEPPTAADSMELDGHFGRADPRMPQSKHPGLRDLQTTLLVSLVIALALLLGWMLGRASWRGTTHTPGPPAPVSAKPVAATPQPEETRQVEPSAVSLVTSKARRPETPSASLAVYQDGKVIFGLKPPRAHGEPSVSDPEPGSAGKASEPLREQIEPEYPEAAKQQHIQGPVVLEAQVGKDGAVQQLAVISGNSMLSTAASDAVRKWRFKPLVQNGRAVPFQIRVRVAFVLP